MDIPSELLTAAQMRAIEQAAIDSGEVTGLELMERAGQGVVDAILAEWPDLALTAHRAVILCGPGNNGGDGFVVARLLKQRGWEVEVFLYGNPDRLPPDARVNWERWAGATEHMADKPLPASQNVDVVVDALFGTGLTRPLPTELLDWWSDLTTVGYEDFTRRVAVDLPSGICSDSGRVIRQGPVNPENILDDHVAFRADLTVTFGWAKLGLEIDEGSKRRGRLVTIDIGLAPLNRLSTSRLALARLHDLDGLERRLARGLGRFVVRRSAGWSFDSKLRKSAYDHKYHHGHALILSGPATRTGAARLAARGALRIGAGLVTVAAPMDALPEHAAQLTAIMLREAAGPDALQTLLEDTRLNALCLGPGMGPTDHTRAMVRTALSAGRKTVLDADALTAFADDPDTLFAQLHDACVLTPHAGEFARLFPDIAEKLNAPATTGPAYSKLDATREAAARAGCTVLYKGPDTVIATPKGEARINASVYDRAAPWLATAGAGDVLAGFITGLLARGLSPLDAASTAAWLHTECALSFGPGLIAEDLPEELPNVFRSLGL